MKSSICAKYIGHRDLYVCLSACLSVCLFAMYRSHHWTDRPDVLTVDVFWFKDNSNYCFVKSNKGHGQGHHFFENQIMGHSFLTGCGKDLVAKSSL